jgi:hypothetical protein
MSEVIIIAKYSPALDCRITSHTVLHNESTDDDSITRAPFGVLDDRGCCDVRFEVRTTYSKEPTNYTPDVVHK